MIPTLARTMERMMGRMMDRKFRNRPQSRTAPLSASIFSLFIMIFLVASCGHEAPVFQDGSIAVSSTPVGAAIILDGQDTGFVTPDTLVNLAPTSYVVSVELEGYSSSPVSQTVTVSSLTISNLPEFSLSQTTLSVTSTPSGAQVFLDGEDTGQTTPALLVDVPAGSVEVSLALDGYLVSPASFTAVVAQDQANEVPEGTFALRARHTVLFEGFSNVSCQGCPEMATNMYEVQHRPEYGPERLLYLKYSMQWPSSADPHYVYNTAENDARMFYYQSDLAAGIPVLSMEGVKVTGTAANSTPDSTEIIGHFQSAWAIDPGYLIDVTADFSNTDVPVTVTLTALEDVSLAGKTLFVALVQTEVEYEEAPGSEGETEFHNLFRDRADSVDDLVDLTAGQTQTINTTVQRQPYDSDIWIEGTLKVLAFVQDDNNKSISQAGSTALTGHAAASQFVNRESHPLTTSSEGDR